MHTQTVLETLSVLIAGELDAAGWHPAGSAGVVFSAEEEPERRQAHKIFHRGHAIRIEEINSMGQVCIPIQNHNILYNLKKQHRSVSS